MTGQIWLFLAAGVLGGIVNAAAGGAKLFVFPMLLAAGLPPVTANATGTVAVWPSQIPVLWVFRHQLLGNLRTLGRQMLPALAGSLVGSIALTFSSDATFVAIVPFLLLISVAAIILGNRVEAVMRRVFPGGRMAAATGVLLFATGVYAGYFGAGYGFILLAILSVGGIALRQANVTKNLFAFAMNTTAVIPMALSGLVDWVAAGTVLVGALVGGYAGAWITAIVPDRILRVGVAGLGLVLTLSFLLR